MAEAEDRFEEARAKLRAATVGNGEIMDSIADKYANEHRGRLEEFAKLYDLPPEVLSARVGHAPTKER